VNDIPVNIRATTVALRFLDSTKLGKNYENDLFVASFNLGVIYHFDLNKDRTALKLPNSNRILAENQDSHSIPFVEGIGKITDMKLGPDGNLYVLSRYFNKGTIFRISK
jgi:glucose/arabinose dehydrogenase